jgi:CBS domain containing-hemolysin-like protein
MLLIILGILTIIFLIFLSAFFSGSEMAFVSVNKAVIVDKARNGDKKAQILEELLQTPDNVISAIVIGNNIVNIFASILAGVIATTVFGNIGIGFATVVMTLLVLIFSEMTPKAFGIKNEKFALQTALTLSLITKLFYPLVVLLTKISNGLIALVGGNNKKREVVTEYEIMAMMRLGEEEGTIEKDEREMVDEVFEFDETRAHEIYIPKDKVEFIQEDTSIEGLIQKSIKTGFSRFPVYGRDLDDIVGMVHVKDSLAVKNNSLPIKTIMRKILKINFSMKADGVLRLMKQNKTHLALLQDINGKTLGLVSMEDLIEEIFGEISDEHDVKTRE